MGSIALDRETLQIVNHLRDAQRVTLVIGAGVSYGRGVPLWGSLAKAVWEEIFGPPYPCVSVGGLEMHPFGHQFALELVERRLRELPSRSSGKEDEFLLTLKRAIYNRVQRPARRTAADNLGVLA